jgi:hypothetical protein
MRRVDGWRRCWRRWRHDAGKTTGTWMEGSLVPKRKKKKRIIHNQEVCVARHAGQGVEAEESKATSLLYWLRRDPEISIRSPLSPVLTKARRVQDRTFDWVN